MPKQPSKDPLDRIVEAARMIAADEVRGAIDNATMTNVFMILALKKHGFASQEVLDTFIGYLEEQSTNATKLGLPDPYKNTITTIRMALDSAGRKQ